MILTVRNFSETWQRGDSVDKKRVSLEFLRFWQLESLEKLDSMVIISAEKKQAGLELLRFWQLESLVKFDNVVIISADNTQVI